MSTETVWLLLPELLLILLATAIYLAGAFLPGRVGWGWVAFVSLLVVAGALYQQQVTLHQKHKEAEAKVAQLLQQEPATSEALPIADSALPPGISSGPILVDLFSQSVRWVSLAVGLALVVLSSRSARWGQAPEYLGSLLLIVAGVMLVGLSGDLVLIFLGLELVSIPTYVMLYLGRGSANQEATVKYFFLSILSSALLLYGFSFLYGVGGSTRLDALHEQLFRATGDGPGLLPLAKLAIVLVFAGLGFRITIVPFHFYAPDVYQGTSNPNAGLLAIVPKIVGLTALIRIVAVSMTGGYDYLQVLAGVGWHLALALSLVTMTLGNLVALWQRNVRRLLAYSSIAHAGYMFIGLAVGMAVNGGASGVTMFDGLGATMLYVLVYVVATLGAFAVLEYLGDGPRQVDTVDDLAGLGRAHPWAAAAMTIFMLSLTGMPPMAGFWGKFVLFGGAAGVAANDYQLHGHLWPWFLALALAGVANAAISAAYYLRVVATMYFRPALAVPAARGGLGAALVSLACVLLVVGINWNPGALIEATSRASQSARRSVVRPLPPNPSSAQADGVRSDRLVHHP